MKKALSIILIVSVMLCLFPACGDVVIDVAKYQAYEDDKVVATVNGINLYYSEVQTKIAYDKAVYDYNMELVNKGQYNLDIYPAPVLKTEDEILDEMIQEEALYQYYASKNWDGEKLLYTRDEAKQQLLASIASFKNNPDEPLAALGLELQKQYYDILNMNEEQWIEYVVPVLIRSAASNSFINAYNNMYEANQTTGENANFPTLDEKINEILESFDIVKFANN